MVYFVLAVHVQREMVVKAMQLTHPLDLRLACEAYPLHTEGCCILRHTEVVMAHESHDCLCCRVGDDLSAHRRWRQHQPLAELDGRRNGDMTTCRYKIPTCKLYPLIEFIKGYSHVQQSHANEYKIQLMQINAKRSWYTSSPMPN